MNFRMKLRDLKRDEQTVVNPWIASGKEEDARLWAKAQMEAWGWLDGRILECAAEYVDPVIAKKREREEQEQTEAMSAHALDPNAPVEYDERGLPILRLTDEDVKKLLAMPKTVPDVYVPEDDNL